MSRESDRSNRSQENKKETSNLDQILDNEFIPDKLKNNQNDTTKIEEDVANGELDNDKKSENNSSELNKLKVEDLKKELNKRNIPFNKNARKQDLIDLLIKEK